VLGLLILGGAFVGLVLVSSKYAHAYGRQMRPSRGSPSMAQAEILTRSADRPSRCCSTPSVSDGPSTSHTIDFD
jgi:hypothetical protein